MMRLRILLAALCLAAFAAGRAQEAAWKKTATVKDFKAAMKDKKYDAARAAVDNAVGKHEEAKADAQLYCMKTEALEGLVDAENRKIYLKQNPDTAKYFNLMLDMHEAGLMCDSLEAAQAEKERGKLKYRPEVSARLMSYRTKLPTAGKFFYKKKNYVAAYKFFDMYLRTKSAPLFSDKSAQKVISAENDLTELSALATLSAYGSGNYRGVMSYLYESLKNKSLACQLFEIGSKSAAELGDSVEMLNLLENGFAEYPETEYFFFTLIKHHNEHGEYDRALAKAKRMASLDGSNRDYLFVKGKEELLMQQLDSAALSFGLCVTMKPDDADSFSSLGNIYIQKAHELYASIKSTDSNYAEKKRQLNELYTQAGQNYENARKFKEDDTSLWLEGLREVYFKLNKGKELKALDKYK